MKKTSAVILLLFLTLFSLPLLVLLLASFVQENGSLTFLQYRAVFESEEIMTRFKNSAVLSLATLAIQAPVSLLGGFTWRNKQNTGGGGEDVPGGPAFAALSEHHGARVPFEQMDGPV
jgi:ABC-type spermidine/putrescine transport system permease subunit II